MIYNYYPAPVVKYFFIYLKIIMINKVRVYGKAQNRTALGIANAYLVMNPKSTLADLNNAFPGNLNDSPLSDKIFIDVKDAGKYVTKKEGNSTYEITFFNAEDELLHLADGTTVAMMCFWTKESFEKIVEHAKQYGIEIAEFKPKEGFRKGGYTLEYLNGYNPEAKPKNTKKIIIICIVSVAVIAIISYFCFSGSGKGTQKNSSQNTEQLNQDSDNDGLTDAQEMKLGTDPKNPDTDGGGIKDGVEVEKKTNPLDPNDDILSSNAGDKIIIRNIEFVTGKADITPASNSILNIALSEMQKVPESEFELVGHTDNSGDNAKNMKLSLARVNSVKAWLTSHGVAANRLTTRGAGATEPMVPNTSDENRQKNRRVVFNRTK